MGFIKTGEVLIIGAEGYIGSRLYQHLINTGYYPQSVDIGKWGNPAGIYSIRKDFSQLDKHFIQYFKTIVLLAGHSSVSACDADPDGGLQNNCMEFVHLVNKLRPDQKFIYSSSGAVYGFSGSNTVKEIDPLTTPVKEYDRHKQAIDRWIENKGYNFYGLRFGTVCGYSKNPRNELMLNSMSRTAIRDKFVKVTNSDSYRAILGLNDLCRAITSIIEGPDIPGFYNLASFNEQIGVMGETVANYFKCSLNSIKGEDRYSFCLNTNKFQNTFNFKFEENIESIIKEAAKNDFSLNRY